MYRTSNTGKNIGLIIAVFGVVGIGIGLTGFISVGWMQGTFTNPEQGEIANSFGQLFVGLILLQSIILAFFTGPTIATVTGLISGLSTADGKQAAVVNGVGSFVGFYVMVVVAVVVMSLAYDGGSSSGGSSESLFDLGNTLTTALKVGIPTGAVGVIAGYLGTYFRTGVVSGGQRAGVSTAQSDD
ncbi:hypothetical protein [Haladaptatus cibarius]|uniref:hypothetical protein n=1 Tax=Haladaptatus cibarius TaxID=453847 RepID=UPI00067869EE|nr:hypothetical protein [Haladaptatus cibarius]